MKKDKIKKSIIYKGFKKVLIEKYGERVANKIWSNANNYLNDLETKYPEITRDSKKMILPAASIYIALNEVNSKESLQLLKEYGKNMGIKISKIIHLITSIPGVSKLLWINMPKLMKKMSSPKLGYTRKIVNDSKDLVGVDILSCPLHNAAKKIGIEEIAQVVCEMDREYMTGFKYINYTRTTSVANGNNCCNYRLSYDKTKK